MAHTRCSEKLKIVNYFFFNFCCWFVCFLQIHVYYIYRFNYLLLTLFFSLNLNLKIAFSIDLFVTFREMQICDFVLQHCRTTTQINREKCQPAISFYNILQLRSLPVSC